VITVAVLTGQLSVGWSNDWFDAARDRMAQRQDKPVAQGALSLRVVAVGALLAGCATVPLSLLAGRIGWLHIAAVGSAWLYNWPLKATPLSVVPYLVSFGLLAQFVVGWPAPWWLLLAAAALGGGAHFANVLGDLEADAVGGVRGLPHRLGGTGSRIATILLLATATGILVWGPPGPPSWFALGVLMATGCVLAVGLVRTCSTGSPALFRAVMVIALLDVLLLVITNTQPR